ncbi:ankyrin repeat-containing domain protein [Aspergillus bertholletiae]|uniref:Ankyrin repeat-containing domain protein n=1 Tax=Aspergillus bertholletiae TaxID=1226010 RepID=A0A5N7ANI6_9EURO|nr:ankyrin repeat-containing domain protein [Aspergillus bertholletiae]
MDEWGDGVLEWKEESVIIGEVTKPVVQEEDAESSYHMFIIPYGKGIDSKKIKKVLFNNDLVSNPPWSAKYFDNTDRFHRHLVFFGTIEEVIHDCCGGCPKPGNQEELMLWKEINQTYVSGGLTFIKDDPGRQMIGSFHPLSEIDWTRMAYLDDTTLFSQAIVDHDFKEVESWIIMLNHGADLTSRLVNGQTALHIAAARGETEIVSMLLTRNNLNSQNNGLRRTPVQAEEEWYCESPPSDYDLDDIYRKGDTYDIDLLSWDTRASPLHLAIIHGHTDMVEELVTFGASTHDTPMLPALALALLLPKEMAILMVKKLLELGAPVVEKDSDGRTAFHYLAQCKHFEVLDMFWESTYRTELLLSTPIAALESRNPTTSSKIMEFVGKTPDQFESFMRSSHIISNSRDSYGRHQSILKESVANSLTIAITNDQPSVALDLIRVGVEPVLLSRLVTFSFADYSIGTRKGTILDRVQFKLRRLRKYKDSKQDLLLPYDMDESDDAYLHGFEEGSSQFWLAQQVLKEARDNIERSYQAHKQRLEDFQNISGSNLNRVMLDSLTHDFHLLEDELVQNGARISAESHNGSGKLHGADFKKQNDKANTFKLAFTFNMPHIIEAQHHGYLRLFEAAWSGDTHEIIKLTLTKWHQDEQPLLGYMCDSRGFSPFSVAVLRGNLKAASTILRIVSKQ